MGIQLQIGVEIDKTSDNYKTEKAVFENSKNDSDKGAYLTYNEQNKHWTCYWYSKRQAIEFSNGKRNRNIIVEVGEGSK